MKFTLVLAFAGLTLGQLVIQNQQPIQQQQQNDQLQSLTLDDFQSIQDALKKTLTPGTTKQFQSPPRAHPVGGEEEDPNHGILDFSQYTVLEILDAALKSPHHDHDHNKEVKSNWNYPWRPNPRPAPTEPSQLPLHRLGYLVSKSEEAQKNLAGEGITLLAPNDWALTPPSHRRGNSGDHKREHDHKKEGNHHDHRDAQIPHPFHSKDLIAPSHGMSFDGGDDEDKKARISKIIGYILKYHTLGFAATAHELADSSTLPTTLNAGRDSDEPLRVRVEPSYMFWPIPHPTLKFNFYSKKIGYTIKAKNGIIHMISAPLLPPFSPLNSLFLFPQAFSTLTSGLQKVNLDEVVLPSTLAEEESSSSSMVDEVMAELMKENGGSFTVFAPTNFAFTRLGLKINAFLHSPFPVSKKVLKYVLSYHLVPDIIFHSDYNTISEDYKVSEETDVPFHLPQENHHDHKDEFSAKWDLPKLTITPPPRKSWWPLRPATPKGGPHHDDNHHSEGRANVTRYVLPTLLSSSGQNINATLRVAVYTYRVHSHGPIRRAVVVLPHHKEEYGGTSVNGKRKEGGRKHGCHGKRDGNHGGEHEHEHEGPHPVRVFKADAVARNGAIHVVNTLLRPPYNYNHRKGEMNHDIAQLFAQ